MIRITKIFDFEMAHRLKNYDGACSNIHGHSYQLHVSVSGKLIENPNDPKNGMILDFGILKKIVNEKIIDIFDHALVINTTDEELKILKTTNLKLVLFDGQPTSEKLITYFANVLIDSLPESITLEYLKLNETKSSFVEWFKD